MSDNYQQVLVETTPEGVGYLTLNRPERYNSVNPQLAAELPAALAELGADAAVRVVVIRGAGRAFCSGLEVSPANVAAFQADFFNPDDDLQWVGKWVLSVVECPKPVIAAVNGAAAGAGFGLTLAADIRLASDAATLTAGYANIALSPDAGVSYFLPRLIGLSRASEIILTARRLSASEAERLGLVAAVFPAAEFESSVAAYAIRLAQGPPLALRLTKHLLTQSFSSDLTEHLRREWATIQPCLKSADFAEGLQAFAEKRPPRFRGE